MQREKVEPGDDAGRQPLPKFVLLGSPLGSIGGIEKRNVPMGAYGASKCAAHYIVRKIHAEEAEVVAFVVDPGYAMIHPSFLLYLVSLSHFRVSRNSDFVLISHKTDSSPVSWVMKPHGLSEWRKPRCQLNRVSRSLPVKYDSCGSSIS